MDILVAIAVLVGLLWGTVYLLRGSLLAGCVAYILLASCFGYQFLHFLVAPVAVTLDRLAIAALLGVYLVRRKLRGVDSKPLAWRDGVLLAFAGVLALSTLTHQWQPQTCHDDPILWHLFSGYLFPLAIYWVARQSPLNERSVRWVHAALACFGVYLAFTGLMEIAGQWQFVFPGYIADHTVGTHFGRARGPMVQSVTYGLYLSICMTALIVWRPRWGGFGVVLTPIIVAVELAALYFSYTRSAWIGGGLALLVALAWMLRGAWRPLVLGALAVAGALVILVNLDQANNLQRECSAADSRESTAMRSCFAYVSWQMFQDRPLWGCGFGKFPVEKLPYLSDRSSELRLESIREYIHHNTYFSLLTETGLIGFGLFLAVLVGWVRCGWTLWQHTAVPNWARAHGVLLLCALTTYIVQMMFHEVSYSTLDNSLIFLLAGIAAGLQPNRAARAIEIPATAHFARPREAQLVPC